jgi:glycosyltransferase involved in cell wall biosynthesis
MDSSSELNLKHLMSTRMEMEKLCEHLGKPPWTLVTNAAYDAAARTDITVVITLYNYAQYIEECLDSVCASKTADLPQGFEVVIIDDCSSDRSARLVEDYIQRSQTPLCLVKKLFNTGLASARNIGLRLARSPYVFVLDADNWIYPNCLSTLYHELVDTEYAGVYGIINKFENQDREGAGLISFYEWDVRELMSCPYIDAMALFKRDILLKLGGYSTDMGFGGWEDYDMWLKIAQAGYSGKLVPQVLSAYRVHSQSMINTTNRFIPLIIKYLKRSFPDLIEEHQDLERIFGLPRYELLADGQPIPVPQASSTAESAPIVISPEALNRLQERIKAMESSKFWQIRRNWIKFKRTLRLTKEEP